MQYAYRMVCMHIGMGVSTYGDCVYANGVVCTYTLSEWSYVSWVVAPWVGTGWSSVLLLWRPLSWFHLTELDGSTAWLRSPLPLPGSIQYINRRLCGDCSFLHLHHGEHGWQPLRRFVPHPCPAYPLSGFISRLTDQCVGVVTPTSGCWRCISLFPSIYSQWLKFIPPSGLHCLLLPVQKLLTPIPLLMLCPPGTNLVTHI